MPSPIIFISWTDLQFMKNSIQYFPISQLLPVTFISIHVNMKFCHYVGERLSWKVLNIFQIENLLLYRFGIKMSFTNSMKVNAINNWSFLILYLLLKFLNIVWTEYCLPVTSTSLLSDILFCNCMAPVALEDSK